MAANTYVLAHLWLLLLAFTNALSLDETSSSSEIHLDDLTNSVTNRIEPSSYINFSSKKAVCGCPPVSLNAKSILKNGIYNSCAFKPGQIAHYSCLHGHIEVNGSSTLVCELHGDEAVWRPEPLTCAIINCGDPGLGKHATREFNSFTFNSYVQYKCNNGYTPDGPPFLRCTEEGKWNRPIPTCNLIQCPHLENLDVNLFFRFSNPDRVVNSTVKFHCGEGYQIEPETDAKRTCKWDGNWSGNNPTCVQRFCQYPSSLPAGVELIPREEKYLVGQNLLYSCTSNKKYSQVTCGKDGQLHGMQLDCPKPPPTHCDPVEIAHGSFDSSAADPFQLGARLTFKCDYNFKLSEPKWIVCQHNGEWTNKQPRCVDVNAAMSSLMLSYILSCIIFIIILILLISFVVLFRWQKKHRSEVQRRRWQQRWQQRYFGNYEYQHEKSFMQANANEELKQFVQSKRLSVPFTDL